MTVEMMSKRQQVLPVAQRAAVRRRRRRRAEQVEFAAVETSGETSNEIGRPSSADVYLQNMRLTSGMARRLDATRITSLADEQAQDDEQDEDNKLAPTPRGTDELTRANNTIGSNVILEKTRGATTVRQTVLPAPHGTGQTVSSQNSSPAAPKQVFELRQQQSDYLNTSNSILILLIGYILWQCIFKSRKKRAKFLQRLRNLRATLLSTKSHSGRNDDDDLGHLEGPQVVGGGDQFELQAANRPTTTGGGETIERMQEEPGQFVQLKRLVTKNSFVVAANGLARPRVELLRARFKDFVARDDAPTLAGRLKTCAARFLGQEQQQRPARPADLDIERGCELKAKTSAQTPTIEAIVHRSGGIEQPASNQDGSLIGLAGSHTSGSSPPRSLARLEGAAIEQDKLVVATQQLDLSPNLSSNSHLSGSLMSNSSSSKQPSPSRTVASGAAPGQNLLSACNAFELACPLESDALVRSRSQAASANQLTSGQLLESPAGHCQAKSASPSICRPCCADSPGSTLRGRPPQHLNGVGHVHLNQQHSLFGCSGANCNFSTGPQPRHAHSMSTGGVGGIEAPRQCASSNNERVKQQYENYYDDEREDAYRRLTASIGVQFGLAAGFEPHELAAAAAAAAAASGPNQQVPRRFAPFEHLQHPRTPACRCCSAAATTNMVGHHLPPSSGDTSLGGSDSGTFSLAAAGNQTATSSSCQSAACTLCRSSPLEQAPVMPSMSILVQQPSVSNTPPPPPQQTTTTTRTVDFEPTTVQPPLTSSAALVSRWNQRRRSTMSACSRTSPRRMSLAGVTSWQPGAHFSNSPGHNCSHAPSQAHLLHRASIAADGQHNQLQPSHARHHQHHQLERYQPLHGNQILCAGHQRLGGGHFSSQYSSSTSAGSSSGIGFSGSQCTNTPTTSGFPYGSFMASKPSELQASTSELGAVPKAALASLMGQQRPQQPQQQCCALATLNQCDQLDAWANWESTPHDAAAWAQLQLGQQQQHHADHLKQQLAPMMCQSAIKGTAAAASRKYSLPVQLESNAAEMAEQKRSPNLLFKVPCDGQDDQEQQAGVMTSDDVGETPRRSSQTIARQSSFWLEDNPSDLPTIESSNIVPPPTNRPEETSHEKPVRPPSGSPSSPRPISSASSGGRTRPAGAQHAKAKHARRLSSSSSSASSAAGSSPSPSPDLMGAGTRVKGARSLGLGPSAGSISKRRPLGKLRPGRLASRRSLASARSAARRQQLERQPSSSTSKSRSLEINSTDDDELKQAPEVKASEKATGRVEHQTSRSTEQEDSFESSLDRDFLTAPPPPTERALRDTNSASLERQCRDLWKLRSTLHNDASFGDNWSNYHQRLNRRYDSGYKSIENQFNSSLEGNLPIPTEPQAVEDDAQQTKLETNDDATCESTDKSVHESTAPTDLLARPQSGCSNFLCDNQPARPLSAQRAATPLLQGDDETLALLADCDERQDDSSPLGDTNPTES